MSRRQKQRRNSLRIKRRVERQALRRRRRINNTVSPTITPRTGPGQGHVSTIRHKRARARLRQKTRNPVKVREISTPGSTWQYVVYFFTEASRPASSLAPLHRTVMEFIRTSLSGQFKMVLKNPKWYNRSIKVLNYVKLMDEGDLFSLMLCHREAVRKVFRITNEEAGKASCSLE